MEIKAHPKVFGLILLSAKVRGDLSAPRTRIAATQTQSYVLLFLNLHGQSLHVCILEVEGQAFADEAEGRQVSRQGGCTRTHGLLRTKERLITIAVIP